MVRSLLSLATLCGLGAVAVPAQQVNAPPPGATVRVLSAARRDTMRLSSGDMASRRTETRTGAWLVVWVEGRSLGDQRADLGPVTLAATPNDSAAELRAFSVDTSRGTSGEFEMLVPGSFVRQVQPNGDLLGYNVPVRGAPTILLSGHMVIGLLFDVAGAQPPYRLQLGDSSYAVRIPTAPRPSRRRP